MPNLKYFSKDRASLNSNGALFRGRKCGLLAAALIRILVAVLFVRVATASASAETVESVAARAGAANAVSLQFGMGLGEPYQRTALNYETQTLWGEDLGCLGRVDLSLEIGVAYWSNTGSPEGNGSLFQGTVLPLVRWWLFDSVFIEGGVGPSILSDNHFMEKNLSTLFQFADHIGGGVCLSDSVWLSVRYAHFSNGGIRTPNPGLNVLLLSLAYRF